MEEAPCPTCNKPLRFEKVHTGFNDTGYAYCDRDGSLLVWDTFDPTYTALVGERHPWALDRNAEEQVERALEACPCGGRFGLHNPPLCAHCGHDLRALVGPPIYFADFGQRFDPGRDRLWRPDLT